jgi:A/G-specific adenine glycosylase
LMQLPAFKNLTKCIKNLSFAFSNPIEVKHVLSHRIIYAKFYVIDIQDEEAPVGNYIKLPLSEFHRYPVSRLTEIFQKKAMIL